MGMADSLANVIIPSAVRVSPEMEVDFGAIPPCLVPIAGKVVAERIIDQYPPDTEFFIAIHDRSDLVDEHFAFFPNSKVHLVDVGKTISIADTIERVFAAHPELLEGPFVLNFADTIVEDMPADLVGHDFMLVAKTIESERWTLVRERDGRIVELADKKFLIDTSAWWTLLGVWGFRDAGRFIEVLRSRKPAENRDAFYEAVTEYFNGLSKPAGFVERSEFIDCGHADNYYSARRRLINARFFNELKFNEQSGTIRKTSQNREKLVDEIRWLQSIPKELRCYTPAIFDYSKDPLDPFLEMEFYSYPSLDEAYVSARFDFDSWVKLFDRIFSVIESASKYSVSQGDLDQDLREMYIDKTLARLGAYPDDQFDGPVKVEGREIGGLDSVRTNLEAALDGAGALVSPSFQVIHGDLCLGNILYDAKHGLIKLIDARGRFGRFDIYGDVHYDLAKLSHSILGMYDFIMSGRFRVEEGEFGYRLEFKSSSYHAVVGEIFANLLIQRGYDVRRVRLIESLLFLSMVPLHRDHAERQRAMALQGLSLFDRFGKI
jgi:hypothetical protein